MDFLLLILSERKSTFKQLSSIAGFVVKTNLLQISMMLWYLKCFRLLPFLWLLQFRRRLANHILTIEHSLSFLQRYNLLFWLREPFFLLFWVLIVFFWWEGRWSRVTNYGEDEVDKFELLEMTQILPSKTIQWFERYSWRRRQAAHLR